METFHGPSSASETKVYAATAPKTSDGKLDDTAANAVSFGFIATAILISLFLVIGIFERLLRPRVPLPPGDDDATNGELHSDVSELHGSVSSTQKPEEQQSVSIIEVGISVVMPGQTIPSYIARPAPYPLPLENGCFAQEHVLPGTCDARTNQNDVHIKVEQSVARLL
ncbi:hypothetical protein O6H91_07G018800 [Diphasiastrum complanatum]|uniref:Uncharacterized protein n=5 Tax=Diphasiastrum complanatum TaxID=34168 RepID=A0ACC2D2X2_DIPCM|nr:hypothetical protein O6H91_07G018800 [Diphasiastrum complanatum]KAJ7548597.1 hypothetical protein O6H91_07G018800 [Diphasiastrum complanatum]KAJ7548598.1 hypothetical protein O6H91_07G018800 [Diphasiastrum complanatum]KAJ7548599.1 hypothetical protein O6H91_07G018800 [Diphasiastrum complanatum]KAJ7548600.1 hypothetical protein O6H91_07G018800 [Diphasiastrum complanatum]